MFLMIILCVFLFFFETLSRVVLLNLPFDSTRKPTKTIKITITITTTATKAPDRWVAPGSFGVVVAVGVVCILVTIVSGCLQWYSRLRREHLRNDIELGTEDGGIDRGEGCGRGVLYGVAPVEC